MRLWSVRAVARRSKPAPLTADERAARDARFEADRAAALAKVQRAATLTAVAWLASRRAVDPQASVPVQMRQLAAYRAGLGIGKAPATDAGEKPARRARFECRQRVIKVPVELESWVPEFLWYVDRVTAAWVAQGWHTVEEVEGWKDVIAADVSRAESVDPAIDPRGQVERFRAWFRTFRDLARRL